MAAPGEHVDNSEDGKVVGFDGSLLIGRDQIRTEMARIFSEDAAVISLYFNPTATAFVAGLTGPQPTRVELQMGAGELTVGGGSAKLMEGDFAYNADRLKPAVEHWKAVGLDLGPIPTSAGRRPSRASRPIDERCQTAAACRSPARSRRD